MSFTFGRKKPSSSTSSGPLPNTSVPTPVPSLSISTSDEELFTATPESLSSFPKMPSPRTAPGVPQIDDDLDFVTHHDIGLSTGQYALKCKELLELNSDLRNMGAGTLIDLPRIAVIGGQSAGKSSLVEAVSGINVPRDSGTCTRCPMECTLSSAAQTWSCIVTLRMDYDSHGEALPVPERIPFGPPIVDKAEVDLWIRRAQMAVLSPHLPSDHFLTKSREDLRDSSKNLQVLKFSKNVVCVSIRDPDATDLSFVDLPGLIQNEEQDMINLVRDLVVQYIAGENTLILITIPMSDDMENQQAVRLAREADPRGTRTIGVLTKPDTITKGAINTRYRWLRVIEGNAHQLTNGYYCVRLPDDDERQRKIPRAESLALASTFFETTAPWNEVSNRNRFGIPNFVSDISKLLVSHIEQSLPAMKKDVKKLLTNCQLKLNALPTPLVVDPSTEVIGRITRFCAEVQGVVYGEGPLKTLVHFNRSRYAQFKKDIRETAPDFRPFASATSHCRPQIAGREDDDVNTDNPIGLLDVKEVIRQSIAWELPHNVPFEAKKVLIQRFIACWEDPAEACFEDVFKTLVNAIDVIMKRTLGRFVRLNEFVGALTRREVLAYRAESMNSLHKALALEKFPLFTQNTHYLESERVRWLTHFRHANLHPSCYPSVRPRTEVPNMKKGKPKKKPQPDNSPVSAPAPELELETTVVDVPSDEIPTPSEPIDWSGPSLSTSLLSEPRDLKPSLFASARPQPISAFDEELVVMAEVRAYFQVAYRRIIDQIPLTIEHSLNQALADNLQATLLAGVLTGGQDMDELVSEDPKVARERERLLATKKRLLEIQAKLDEFPVV